MARPSPRQLIGASLILVMIVVLIWRERDTGPDRFEREFYVLGTLVTVTINAEGHEPDALAAATAEVESALRQFQVRWQPTGDGALGQLNQRLASSPAAIVPESLRDLLAQAKAVADDSDGTFDPGLAHLVRLWGFHDPEHFRETPPDDDAIARALDQPHRLAEARLDQGTLTVGRAGLALDLGAIGKGAAVGQAVATLQAAGIDHALVNAGGDLQAIGQAPNRPWRIAVRHPRPQGDDRRLLAGLTLADGEAVFSSGDYERYFEHDGMRYHHLLDPATGRPARGAQSATVIHTDAALADAAATALFVGGPERFVQVVEALGITQAMLVDADGHVLATPAFAERVDWLAEIDFAPGSPAQ